jgi:hypothetical protein
MPYHVKISLRIRTKMSHVKIYLNSVLRLLVLKLKYGLGVLYVSVIMTVFLN